MTDEFLDDVVPTLAGLPGVHAVTLGGSRAQGSHRPDSDWDMAVYYRGTFEPQALRDVGWPGEVFELGAWGGGVFNSGAWLEIEGRRVDVHYRDLAVVEHVLAEAADGRFHIEPLLFHLAGIPSYLLVAELAINRVLHGSLPRPTYPAALRREAPAVWWQSAELLLGYASDQPARQGRASQTLGLTAQAASQAAHAVLAAQGEWITNEKTLLPRAGLDEVDAIVAGAGRTASGLERAVADVRELCRQRLADATG